MKGLLPKSILLGITILSTITYADGPKKYTITLSTLSRIGSAEFQPGEYKLIVDTSRVRLMDTKTGKETELGARVETVQSKFDQTALVSSRVDGTTRLEAIHLGGSKTKVSFE